MKNRKLVIIIFTTTIIFIISLFVASIIRVNIYNSKKHEDVFSGEQLFTSETDKDKSLSVNASARSGTWGKIFDFNDEGLTENNYQALTYDFNIINNTHDEIKKFSFKLEISHESYLYSAWNGAVEIHQFSGGNELVETIQDLRDYNEEDYNLNFYHPEDEGYIVLHEGDYIIYHPSTSKNAVEMPIKSHEGTTPGFIIYVEYGQTIEDSTLTIEYTMHRMLISTPLFGVSSSLFLLWAVALLIVGITSLQARKYRLLHERDNKIIVEAIETFTGFIDAKDPYTNGHSKRVGLYTRLIAEKMGYTGEDLDKIYFMALLHDSGKIAVPDNVLRKPGKLNDEEYEIIKSHTVRGGDILSKFKSLGHVEDGARYHHERYDGNGYPDKLKGEEIPLISRMICVADSFDAMNTSRVYREKLPMDYIIKEIENNKGKQFDPKIADILLELIKEGKIK